MSDLELGAILRYEDQLVEAVACYSGPNRQWTLRPVGAAACPACGSLGDINIVEGCLIWQQNVKPVKTLRQNKGDA
jgi:hypothetical protein